MDLSLAAIENFRKRGITVILVTGTQQILKMTQVVFPIINATFTGVNGRVSFAGEILGNTKFVFRVIVHNLTGDDRTVFQKSFTSLGEIGYIVGIPAGATRIRIEMQAFTPEGTPASNVFNESKIKTPDEPTPTTFKNCTCCGITIRIPATEPCPTCGTCDEVEKPPKFVNLEGLVVGALALGALLPLGRKKK